LQQKGESVSHVDLRHVYPFPSDLGDILSRFDKVLIPELNLGQLRMLIRSEYLIEPEGLNKVQGKPFAVFEIVHKMEEILKQP
jgi:2-oxoglutarate ferredoxin oxidoreductase subunit alpha